MGAQPGNLARMENLGAGVSLKKGLLLERLWQTLNKTSIA